MSSSSIKLPITECFSMNAANNCVKSIERNVKFDTKMKREVEKQESNGFSRTFEHILANSWQ